MDDPSNNLEESIDWLLSQAILLEYKDRRQELLHTRPPEAQRTTHGSGSTFHDVSSDEFKDSVIVLGQALGIVTEGKELSEILREANERLSTLQNPAFQFSAKQHAKLYAKDTSAIIPSEEAESLPLGFQTGDATVDSAATLLRLLYVRDLRKLQSSIDQTIVQIQEWTSNPKTDATLGKVGR